MKPHCRSLPCTELREKRDLYLMKSEMLGHLRREHRRYWTLYERLYNHGGWREAGPDDDTPYSDRAKELLTRCRMFDNLYNNLVRLDLKDVEGFGTYCKHVFGEINRLKPAFPEAAVSVGVFDETVRNLRKFVMKQNDRWSED